MKPSVLLPLLCCTMPVYVLACGLFAATADKAGIARDAAALALIEQHCELEQKLTEGQAGARAEVDAQCEKELDAFDAKGAP